MTGIALTPVASTCFKTSLSPQLTHRSLPRNVRHRNTARRATSASFINTGYALADAATKVADTADKAAAKVGSVDAPAWVLPVAAISVAVVLTASSFLLKPGVEASEQIRERDAKRWSNKK